MSNDKAPNHESPRKWGLAGIGVCGRFTVEIDDPQNGEGPWRMHLSGPRWNVTMDISGREEARSLCEFVAAQMGKTKFSEHRFGPTRNGKIVLIKDDESPVRFFLSLALLEGDINTRLTIQDDEATEFFGALEEVCHDLFDDDTAPPRNS